MMRDPIDRFVNNIEISRGLLASLTEYIDNHMETDPDSIDWGHVGSSAALRSRLEELVEEFGLMPVEK